MFRSLLIAVCLILTPAAALSQYVPEITSVDPSSLVSVKTVADVIITRNNLRQKVFGSTELPAILPVFDYNYSDWFWDAKPNIGGIKALHVDLPYGVKSIIWRWTPAVPRVTDGKKCGFIVHSGHSQFSVKAPYQDMIAKLMALGCEVTAIDMPLSGLNNVPTVIDTGHGKIDVTKLGSPHGNLAATASATFSPLRFFMDAPLAVVNDYVARGITNIGMFGLSGGGWTTDLYSALDPRVDLSVSLAGSMPVYMRSWVPPMSSLGDWEQMEIPSLGIDYMDLYILASVGYSRHHANLYIVNDDCCFGGYNAAHYKPAVLSAVADIADVWSGEFMMDFDTTVSTHTVSAWSVNKVAQYVLAYF